MSPLKEQVIELIKSLPDDCTWEDIQYHIYVREKVERGIQDINEGKVLTQDEVEGEIKKWLKSSGQKPL
jgi:predicted transcriptional regulator